jgi:hypothetical protein
MDERQSTRTSRIPAAGLPALLVAGLLGLAGCSSNDPIKAIGAVPPPPDEFQVVPRKPLVVTASANLPTPVPGMPSPLEPDPYLDAETALAASHQTEAAGEAGDSEEQEQAISLPATAVSVSPSAGEQILLRSANASATRSDIRVQIEADRVAGEESKPYEAPTIVELFAGRDESIDDPDAVLAPIAEAQRLQKEGDWSPSDPEARAVEPDKKDSGGVGLYYSSTGDRRPQNKVTYQQPAQ